MQIDLNTQVVEPLDHFLPAEGARQSEVSFRSGAVGAKALLVANTAWYLFNFRSGLLRELQQQGWDIVVVSPYDDYVQELRKRGIRWIEWKLDRANMNPLRDFRSLVHLAAIYRREKPDLIHHFTIKPILYGTLAARWCKIRCVVNSVTGLGHVFISHRPLNKLVRPFIKRWYQWALTTTGVRPIFQNQDDFADLSRSSSRPSQRLAEIAVMTNGSGIDLSRFSTAQRSERARLAGTKKALFAGRLLYEKGVSEFVEAARICKSRRVPVQFVACGSPDPGNPSSIPMDQFRQWRVEGDVEFLGHCDRIEEQIKRVDVVVLPSYREGMPRVLLEGAAMGKPLIATDVPGCRNVVDDGVNGILVSPRNAEAIADAVESLVNDDALCKRMGRAGRRRIAEKFDERRVVAQTMRVYRKLFHVHPPANRPRVRRNTPAGLGSQTRPKMSLGRGVFLLSLDFELGWGTRNRPAARHAAPFLDGARKAVDGLLALLERYEISATWAMVGALLLTSDKGGPRHPWLGGRQFDDIPAGDSASQPHWYAEDLIERLVSATVPQEIGCHSLTHAVVDAGAKGGVNPRAEGREAFRRELQLFGELFQQWFQPKTGPKTRTGPTTFIFPKAMMGHFDVLAEEGYRCIRGPESKWFESLPGKTASAACRLVDARFGCRPRVDHPYLLPHGLWVLPSSQFYSPFMSVGKHVSVAARVRKAFKGLHRAAKGQGIFHLWTHPFNLGVRTEELLQGLELIFQEARRLADQSRLDIVSMEQLTHRLDQQIGAPQNRLGRLDPQDEFVHHMPLHSGI